jgi:hypothetical protein
MRTNLFTRAIRVGAVAALLGATSFQAAVAEEAPEARRARRGLDLQALVFGVMEVNRVFCGINVLGELCVDPTNSPVIGGGFWPKGTPNQYIFNSGLQLGGVINSPGFDWHEDTTGVYFMDPRGDQGAGDPVSLVFNSLDPDDLENWPVGAMVRDTAIYNDVLIGRKTLAQQDLWVRIWDGNPTISGARAHPMGVLVEERGLGWNFPSGNEDIVYFIYTFYNITAEDPAAYAGVHPDIRDSIVDIAQAFVAGVEDRFGVDIPSGGYALEEFYAAFFMDPDVGDAGSNYSTAILPFSMAVAYKSDFLESSWSYPADINGPPFHPAPGFIGVKYLKSPIDPVTGNEIGLTMFSNTLNQATGFPDPIGVIQMWRYISGNIDVTAGDNPCTFPNPKERRLCFLYDQFADTRFYQSSGPLTLQPGGSATIVVAYVHAAPVSAPLVASGEIGGDFKPLTPYPGDSIAANTCLGNPGNACVRPLEEVAGWVSHNDDDGSGAIEQDEVVSVPRSLLDKAIVAQAVFDNKFLLPFAPEPVSFFLVPGDNSVTVVWERSPSEINGDPFFQIASDVTSPLFDPNFREFDVEGYRIYRGRTTGQLELIAQFDYAGTTMTDFNGQFSYVGNCAPELGITADCPTFPNDVDLFAAGPDGNPNDVIQIPPGGRVLLSDGTTVLNVVADTAVTGGNSGYPALDDSGVPFAFVDRGVRNGFTYYYAVTGFDVNSVKSGPSSLEGAQVTQSVIPRSTAANQIAAEGVTFELIDRDGNVLDPAAPLPTLDATTGTFSGPWPPSGALAPLAAELFADGLVVEGQEAVFQIDSLDLFYYHECRYYLTITGPLGTEQTSVAPGCPLGEEQEGDPVGPFKASLPADSAGAAAIGLDGLPLAGEVQAQLSINAVTFQSRDADWHPAVDGSFFNPTVPSVNDDGGSRWFDGDNETMADPALGGAGFGQLTGVNAIFQPAPFNTSANALFRRNLQTIYHSFRAADVKVYWGATPGTVDSVIDVTHNMPMAFNAGTVHKGGWGFREDIAASSITQAPADGLLDEYDFGHGPCFTARPSWSSPNCASFPYLQAAVLEPAVDIDADGLSDGPGFAMTINGHFFLFQTATLPSSTVWTLRSYMGLVDKSSGEYAFTPKPSNAPVLGLRLRATVGAPAQYPDTGSVDLEFVHTVPDPYYVTTSLEATSNNKLLQFVNLPTRAIIRIYSLSGILVAIVEHNDPTGGGTASWDLRNRNSQVVASGVYFYHIETVTGEEKVGRFTVVNFAQ